MFKRNPLFHHTGRGGAVLSALPPAIRGNPSGSFGRKERKRDHFVDVTKMVAAKEAQ